MSKEDNAKAIKKVSIVLLSGILGIVVFINTSLIQQAILMDLDEVEISMIISGINLFSFFLLLVSILFFTAMMPFEEVWCSLKYLFNKNCDNSSYKLIESIRIISFSLAVISFSVIFIVYMFRFSLIFL